MDVSLETWQVGPENRWAYQHVEELIPTALVARGNGPTWALPEREDPRLAALPELAEVLQIGYVDGLAVVHDGRLVLERYLNGMTPATLHVSQSVGKSVLGLLCGILAGRGALDPAAPVTELVPEIAGSGWSGARIEHLLDMTAGIAFVEDYAVDFWRYDIACGWHPPRPDAPAETILDFLPSVGAAAWAHGARHHYATPNTDLLGIAAERAGGAPLAELIARELWAPLGAEADARLTVDPAGTAAIGGGFLATLRDYARLGALVLEGGRGLVPSEWVAGLGRGDPAAFARPTVPEATAGASGYAKQWWARDGRTMARGIHGQFVIADPEGGFVIAALSSWPDAIDPARDTAHRALAHAVGEALRAP